MASGRQLKDCFTLDNDSTLKSKLDLPLNKILVRSFTWMSDICEELKAGNQTYFRAMGLLYQFLELKYDKLSKNRIQKYLSACYILAHQLYEPLWKPGMSTIGGIDATSSSSSSSGSSSYSDSSTISSPMDADIYR